MKEKENKIKEVGEKLDKLLEKAGQYNKYQFLILILFFIEFICNLFFNRSISFLETRPYIFTNFSKNESILLTQKMCDNKTQFVIDESKLSSSILYDYEIYCDKLSIYLLNTFLYVGMIFGSFISYIFADKIGRKKSLLIIMPFHIISLYSFEFTKIVIFGKEFEYSLDILYIIIFFEGFFSYILMVLMIIYICDIIKQNHFPLFITLLISGLTFSELISSYTFNFLNYNWRHILSIVASISLITYFFIFYKLVESPMFFLNNEDFDGFVKCLMKISKYNGNDLYIEDFDFLKPYMNSKQRKSFLLNFKKNSLSNSLILENEDDNESVLLSDELYLDVKSGIGLPEDFLVVSKKTMKEDFLNDKENLDKPILSLFGKLKMKDYTPFDLLSKSQIKNFLILSYLWIVSLIIRNGFSIFWKNIPQYQQYYYLSAFMFFGELVGFFVVYKIFTKTKSSFHPTLVCLILLNFIFLLIGIQMNQKFSVYYFFELLIIKVICGSMFLILTIITSLIYPLIIRSKGLGGNLSIATIGDIISVFLAFELEINNITLYFLMFEFFGLVFSYGLPNKIGTVILEEPYKQKKSEENLNNYKFGRKTSNEIIDEELENIENMEKENKNKRENNIILEMI